MATQPVEIRLQLASTRREHTQPIRRPRPIRAAPAAVATPPPVEVTLPFAQVALHKLRSLPRPSWLSVVLAFVAAAAAMWWIMSQRLPDIDPDAVIRTNLEAARQAAAQERFVEPLDRSALNYYRTVLALDPANAEARRGVEQIAEYFVERVKTSIVDGRIAEAAVALDGLKRADPAHRRLPLLDEQLRRTIEERSLLEASVASAAATRETAPKAAPPKAARSEKPAKLEQPDTKAPDPERAPASELLASIAPIPRATPDLGGNSEFPETGAPTGAPTMPAPLAPAAIPTSDLREEMNARAEMNPTAGERSGAGPDIAPAASPPAPRKLVNYVAPEYPREAQMRGIEGWIDMTLFVTPEGDVVDPRIEGGKARQLFDRSALVAVRRWKYDPQPGQSVPQRLQVRVTFELKD